MKLQQGFHINTSPDALLKLRIQIKNGIIVVRRRTSDARYGVEIYMITLDVHA